MSEVKLTPEQAAILTLVRCVDQMLEALEVGFGHHDWASFRQSWVTASDDKVQAIFKKAEGLQDNNSE